MKKRFIACVVACAMLLMGTGYAYWTDLFTISGTVDTGNFNVKLVKAEVDREITDYEHYPLDVVGDHDLILNDMFSTAEGTVPKINDSASSVTFDVNEMYPGHGYEFEFKADNLGTVAAKLDSILFTKDMTPALVDALGISLVAEINDVYYKWVRIGWIEIGYEIEDNNVVLDIVDGDFDFVIQNTQFVSLSNVPGKIAAGSDLLYLDTRDLLVDSDHEMTIKLAIAMDPDAEGAYTSGGTWLYGTDAITRSDDLTENKGGSLTLKFLWDQYNAKQN